MWIYKDVETVGEEREKWKITKEREKWRGGRGRSGRERIVRYS